MSGARPGGKAKGGRSAEHGATHGHIPLSQMPVEPVGEQDQVPVHPRPAVVLARTPIQGHRGLHPDLATSLDKDLRLMDGDQLVGFPMDDVVGGTEADTK